jgi:UDP-N-acetylglucosamine--N-acetylmuramyl-(pentapeptide) pyrophosphoryl-undecaprenol N-acetylglucosamine transferase
MELALAAATVAVSRAGAASLAEIAAMRLPAILIPYPAAVDDHQLFNARAFAESGAARLLEQRQASPERLAEMIAGLLAQPAERSRLQQALARWHHPRAADEIARRILQLAAVAAGDAAGRRDSGVAGETNPGDSARRTSVLPREEVVAP